MRSVVSALLVTTALALSQGPTVAQDVEPGEWWSPDPFSGAYIGGTAGWVHADADQLVTLPGDPAPPPVRFSSDDDGWAAGLHAGYNWQFGSAVYGFETDFSYMDVNPSLTLPINSPSTLGETLRTSYEYFGTVRGRLGWAFQNILVYGTGGFAYAGLDHTFIAPMIPLSQSDDDVRAGWTAGGGTEWAIDPYTFLRVEALYVDLEDTTIRYVKEGCPECRTRIRWEDDFVVARVGLSVKVP